MRSTCPRCRHALDHHLLVTENSATGDRGIVLCPTNDCECFGCWGMPEDTSHLIVDRFQVALIREQLQTIYPDVR